MKGKNRQIMRKGSQTQNKSYIIILIPCFLFWKMKVYWKEQQNLLVKKISSYYSDLTWNNSGGKKIFLKCLLLIFPSFEKNIIL